MWEIVDAIGSAVGAVASMGAVVAAVIAGRATYRLLKMESERDRQAAERERKHDRELSMRQAAMIGIWTDFENATVSILNNSSLPIYNVWLLKSASKAGDQIPLRCYVDDGRPALDPTRVALARCLSYFDVIKPSQEISPDTVRTVHVFPDLQLVFRDNAGNWWQRSAFSGQFRQVAFAFHAKAEAGDPSFYEWTPRVGSES